MKKSLFILAALSCASCKTTISGVVTTPSGQAAYDKHGKVNITRLDNPDFEEIVALDDDGSFESESDLKPGDYLVEPLIPGFQSNSLKVTISEDKHVTIQAIPLPKKKSKAIEAHNMIEVDNGSGGAIINPPRL